jgi:hypothetical protein
MIAPDLALNSVSLTFYNNIPIVAAEISTCCAVGDNEWLPASVVTGARVLVVVAADLSKAAAALGVVCIDGVEETTKLGVGVDIV